MAEMYEAYPIWWRGVEAPPPAEWAYVFEDFTGDDSADEWAMAAAVFIAQTRRRTGVGPTFFELFSFLLPDTGGMPGPFPEALGPDERRRAISGFRGHVTIEWRRRGMISFDRGVKRSLRVGREFRQRSRQRQQEATREHRRESWCEVGASPPRGNDDAKTDGERDSRD